MSNEVRTIFNRIAPVYDQLNDRLSLGQHRIWKEMTVKWSGVKLGDTSLDLCCGSGDLTFRLARHVGMTGQIYGVDFSANLLDTAQERCKNHHPQPPISWIEADVLNLPFDDNYFDAATMGYGLRNVKVFLVVCKKYTVFSNQEQKLQFWTFIVLVINSSALCNNGI